MPVRIGEGFMGLGIDATEWAGPGAKLRNWPRFLDCWEAIIRSVGYAQAESSQSVVGVSGRSSPRASAGIFMYRAGLRALKVLYGEAL